MAPLRVVVRVLATRELRSVLGVMLTSIWRVLVLDLSGESCLRRSALVFWAQNLLERHLGA